MLLKEHSLCIYFYFIQKIYLCHSTFTLYPLYCISTYVMFINFHIHVHIIKGYLYIQKDVRRTEILIKE